MARVARVLQAIGWVWVVAGFVGPMMGFGVGSVFPGVILLFVSRLLRTQAMRQAPPDQSPPEGEPERTLNTERTWSPLPAPPPTRPPAPPVPTPARETVPETRDDVLEEILMAGREATVADDGAEFDRETDYTLDEGRRPMTSEELIAEAKKGLAKGD